MVFLAAGVISDGIYAIVAGMLGDQLSTKSRWKPDPATERRSSISLSERPRPSRAPGSAEAGIGHETAHREATPANGTRVRPKSMDSPGPFVSSSLMSTSTHLPLCVYCGTARPADQTRCPQCGRPWIDVRVGAHGQDRVPAMAGLPAIGGQAAADAKPVPVSVSPAPESGDTDLPPDEEETHTDSSRRFMWLIPALIAAVAIVVITLFAFGVLDGPNDETDETAAPATTVPAVPTTAVPTTVPPVPTTTVAPTTTSTTTTTTTIPEPSSFPAVGEAIPMASLTLKASGIGPIAFDAAAPDAIGRLVASLGHPEETGAAGEDLGLCAGDDGRFVRWVGLTVVVSGTFADGTIAGYRYEDETVPTMHLDLATPSGLRVGDPVSMLNRLYASYQIDYVSSEGTDLFRLSDADGLLLWGPVSSIEDSGRVEGIYAPDVCSS